MNRTFILGAFMQVCLAWTARAATGYADSDAFALDARDSIASIAVDSNLFPLDTRFRGNSGAAWSSSFTLNTSEGQVSALQIVGPTSVLAGSKTSYQLLWQGEGSILDVTGQSRWRIQANSSVSAAMVPPELFAGETADTASITLVASYFGPNGVSFELAPFVITVLPRLSGTLSSTSTAPGVVQFSASVQGESGALAYSWDLNGDGQFGDAFGPSVSRDYGTWTGSTWVKVEVTDGTGKRWVETRQVVLNKPPAPNQPVVAKPAWDPGGFTLHRPDTARSSFVFNAGGLNRRDSGLVVIAHGLRSSVQADWMREMGAAIEARCFSQGMTPPDIALLDWSDLADPLDVPQWAYLAADVMLELANSTLNWKFLAGYASLRVGVPATDFLGDVLFIKPRGRQVGQMLANWVYLNGGRGANPQIDVQRPLHFIGHSAGGFVVGEAARLLKHPTLAVSPIYVDRVTMLDTPAPYKEHYAQGSGRFPNPGRVERVVSSFWGMLAEPFAWTTDPHTWYRRVERTQSGGPLQNWGVGESGHGYAYVWFTRETTWNALDDWTTSDGFSLSPILNPSTRIPKPWGGAPGLPEIAEGAPVGMPDMPLVGWQTFGSVVVSNEVQVLTEQNDAGLWLDLSLPVTAASLKFDFRFLQIGDGDFLAVHAGDLPVLYHGLDLELSRDGWLPVEIPIGHLATNAFKLVFTLGSRGSTNALLGLRQRKRQIPPI
jgi:hypothetical protein